jgi:hypothetical protein
MTIAALDDIQPKAVMTAAEEARWNALPPEEQLARIRAAIQRGIDSGASKLGMDDIWAKVAARYADAKLF